MEIISGFSKLNKSEKIDLLAKQTGLDVRDLDILKASRENPAEFEDIIEKLSENYISNYILPYSIAPNFFINDKRYFVPMVTEESSVVAAAAYAAKFWSDKGGFKTKIIGTKKSGQVYFNWSGDIHRLLSDLNPLKEELLKATQPLLENMAKRGGGITGIFLKPGSPEDTGYHTLSVEFETADSMGANLINSCLEAISSELVSFIKTRYSDSSRDAEIIMAILSNYTPDCLVECTVECTLEQLSEISAGLPATVFARKFNQAVQIAKTSVERAVTHNKGIYNGIDAVLIATGNDFRAVEACGHAFASAGGAYSALNDIDVSDKKFRYTLRIPMALGTVGGITSVHPLVKTSLKILQNPSARELMQVVASVGMASNFAAIRSLVTDGIQKGHMKLHLDNILNQAGASPAEIIRVKKHFSDKQVSHRAVMEFLKVIRKK